MTKNRRKLSLMIGTVMMALGAGLVATPEAIALPDYGYDIYYYSDANHTTLVGEAHLYCNARHDRTGQQTAFYDYSEYPCGW